MYPFTSQNALLFLELPFFQNWSIIFKHCPFASGNCPFVFKKGLFISQKCCIVFQNCPLVFQKFLLFIYCARLFPIMSFFQIILPLLVQLKTAQEDNISLALVLFPLSTIFIYLFIESLSPLFSEEKLNPSSNHYQIKWFKVTSILDNVKTSTWSMAFHVFYSNVSLHDSLENAVSEHFWNFKIFLGVYPQTSPWETL